MLFLQDAINTKAFRDDTPQDILSPVHTSKRSIAERVERALKAGLDIHSAIEALEGDALALIAARDVLRPEPR